MEIKESTIDDYLNFEPSEPNIKEITAVTDAPLRVCMMTMWNSSLERYTVKHQGKTLCLLGVCEGNEFWVFFSKLDKLPLSFYKLAKEKITGKPFHGKIYKENIFAVKMIKFLGYEVTEPFPYGYKGELFMNFYRKET